MSLRLNKIRAGVFRHLHNRVTAGLFNQGYYVARNPDVTGNAVWHYLRHGRAEGRSPHPLFEPMYYARVAGIRHLPPGRWLAHYLVRGEARGINPHPLVDLRRLAKGYGVQATGGLLARFAQDSQPPCSSHPLFDIPYYFGRYPDVAKNGINPLVHYLLHGEAEDRQPSPYFNSSYYLAQLQHPVPAGMTALQHYAQIGGPLGLAPSPRFDPHAFLTRHPGACRKDVDPLTACLDMYQGEVPGEFTVQVGILSDSSRVFTSPRGPKNIVIAARDRGVERVIGSIERISRAHLAGWAMDLQNPSEPLQLDLLIDDTLLSSTETRIPRPDVTSIYGGTGRPGFNFDLPPNLDNDEPVRIEVRSRLGSQDIENDVNIMFPVPDAKRAPSSGNRAIYLGPGINVGNAPARATPARVAIIVLNLDGASLLEAFFESFSRINSYRNVEILIVDHASSDNSRDVVRQYARTLPVRLLARETNYSFSESNNWAAGQTDAEVLMFVNNDIEFCQDIVGGIQDILRDESVGMVGIKLMDKPLGRRAVIASTVQHVGVYFRADERDRVASAFEARPAHQFDEALHRPIDVPGVTAAFVACRQTDFAALGGFDPAYFYGYEDVDLCLRFQSVRGKRVVCANHLTAIHHRGVTRFDPLASVSPRTRDNWAVIDSRFGYWLRRRMAADQFTLPGYWTSLVPRIGFAVTQASDEAPAGDYFTALELALELQRRMPCKAVFLELERGNWHDANGLDVLIVMRDDYDLSRLQHRSPRLITIGWARNWMDRWAERPWAQDYDAYWASSTKAAGFLSKQLARPVEVVPIATSAAFFSPGAARRELKSDYCFTGSFWNASRDIANLLDPDALPFDFALYGHGWEKHPVFSRFTRGGLPYSQMKSVYASTRVVVDDANSVTKQWGSVNSRVYDALAAGALVITNGVEGARATFGELLPTYSTAEELKALLKRYLTDEPARLALVEKLRREVADSHTYAHRAQRVEEYLRHLSSQRLRFAIKIGTPSQAVREEWGDYHFAVALRRAFTRQGHSVRIDCLDEWYRPETLGDDVVLVLRGLSKYEPKSHQVNLMWNISHPDKVSDEEYEGYDHVFVASASYSKVLAARLRVPVTALLQCTDPELFNPDVELRERHEVLFVGNSRKVLRPIVKETLSAGLPLSVFGTRWETIIPALNLKGTHIPNRELAGHYASAGVVLNDHWDTMREHGFLSNRLFDAAACGARIVTDRLEGLDEVFGDLVLQYDKPAGLKTAVDRLLRETAEERGQRLALARQIMQAHNYDVRAESILSVALELDRRRMKPGSTTTA